MFCLSEEGGVLLDDDEDEFFSSFAWSAYPLRISNWNIPLLPILEAAALDRTPIAEADRSEPLIIAATFIAAIMLDDQQQPVAGKSVAAVDYATARRGADGLADFAGYVDSFRLRAPAGQIEQRSTHRPLPL